VTDVQRSGRIGRDELHVDPKPDAEVALTERAALLEDLGHDRANWPSASQKLMKPGPAISALETLRPEPQLGDDPFRHASRIGLLQPGEDHGEIGGQVAVPGIARALEHELDAGMSQPLRDPRELSPERVAHSAPFLALDLVSDAFGSALAGVELSLVSLVSLFAVEASPPFSPSGALRGPCRPCHSQ